MLRKMFGLKGEEITGKWRKLRSVNLYYLFYALYIIRVNNIKEDEFGTVCGPRGRVMTNEGNFVARCESINCSRRTLLLGIS